ncbi:frataxin, mitochondrial-like [Saccostrea echinata]|uniref:frataxin, mitochondrial-like n=1 Tax=Saccostrea echinata TaxID=191078 RepID=UPI002A8229F6|nr:frataxin, mitochondrial-like [Saccostrea echinata]
MRSKLINIVRLSNRLLSANKLVANTSYYSHSSYTAYTFKCPSANFSTGSVLRSQLSESEYHAVADETMDSLTEMFEDLPEVAPCDPEYDAQYSSGVLTVKISDKFGTYVINKQPSNVQIWLSSPVSGPFRYDFTDETWVYSRTSQTMHELLSEEVSKALDTPVDFTTCSYGSWKKS